MPILKYLSAACFALAYPQRFVPVISTVKKRIVAITIIATPTLFSLPTISSSAASSSSSFAFFSAFLASFAAFFSAFCFAFSAFLASLAAFFSSFCFAFSSASAASFSAFSSASFTSFWAASRSSCAISSVITLPNTFLKNPVFFSSFSSFFSSGKREASKSDCISSSFSDDTGSPVIPKRSANESRDSSLSSCDICSASDISSVFPSMSPKVPFISRSSKRPSNMESMSPDPLDS